jgi:hypothetical protein
MPAGFALVSEIFGNLRFFRKEITLGVLRNFLVQTFGLTPCTAEDPFRIVGHGLSLGDRPSPAYPATLDLVT